MADATDNLVLELLRAIRARQDEHSRAFDDLNHRLGMIEQAQRAARRDTLNTDENVAMLRDEVERLRIRLDRVDTRLGLID
jgi:predicted  nucleic acid-binding Zn-ribbon protein